MANADPVHLGPKPFVSEDVTLDERKPSEDVATQVGEPVEPCDCRTYPLVPKLLLKAVAPAWLISNNRAPDEEAIVNGLVPETPWTANDEMGLEVPTPTFPVEVM